MLADIRRNHRYCRILNLKKENYSFEEFFNIVRYLSVIKGSYYFEN